MKISKKTQYGLRAMVYLAQVFESGKICPLSEISKKENISFVYLEKILKELEKNRLVKSKRGVSGGYALYKTPSAIKIGEVIRVLEKDISPVRCIALERTKRYCCPRKKICRTIGVWKKIQDGINKTLNSITLADLIKEP